MAAGKFKLYDTAKEYIGDSTIDLDSNTFKLALFTSASNANTLTNSTLASLTNQVSGNGYPAGGNTLSSVTWVNAAGTLTFDAADTVFTASGGSITSRFAVIYRSGTVNSVTDALLAVCLLEVPAADVTVTDGNTLTVAFNASGIFTLSGATTD